MRGVNNHRSSYCFYDEYKMQKQIEYENSLPHHEWDSHTSPIYQSLKLHREMNEEKNKRGGALIFKKKND